MSILGLYADMYYDAPDDDLDGDDDTPICPPDALTVTASGGWWSAGPDLSDE